jgi:hypothetical protein
MADYGHDLSFGIFVTPRADAGPHVPELAQRADAAGLDWVSVQDHPYQPAFLDAWTLLTAIAASTSRIGVFPNVVNLPLRPPAVLAQAVASLDILSGGRVELGLGAGAFWDAIEAMGGPRRTAGESVDALREGIAVVRALWTPGHGARLDGRYYSLNGAKPGPFPAHDVGIWVGAYKERMLRLTGEAGDGWLPSSPYAPPEQLTAMNAVIDSAAEAAGRSPAAVRRIYNIAGSFGGSGSAFLQGPPKVWVEQLAGLALDEGMSGFVLISQVAAGSLDVAAARTEINKLTMRQNQWTVGAYCESYCRLVGLHHTLESTALFPGLSRLDSRLTPVTTRLHDEHEAIAGLLARVDAALVALVTDPVRAMASVRAAVDLLTDALLSHLSYEEHQLLEPLARFGQKLYDR